jgi:hypothetical protein
MNMNGASGFLLTGTKVYNEPDMSADEVESDSRTSASPLKKKARTDEEQVEEEQVEAPAASSSPSSS